MNDINSSRTVTRSHAILAAVLLITTFGAVAVFAHLQQPPHLPPPKPPVRTEAPVVEVVFALDTTGSMAGLIHAAKEKIWSIASSMAQAQPAPIIRMGIVAYRDRGDAYVTRRIDLSSDLDSMYAALMDLQAAGGGDHPESVNQALKEAIEGMSWSSASDTYRAIFLVGDAPPHTDYPDDVQFPALVSAALARGIVVNTVQCGTDAETARIWRQIAAASQADYFQVDQGGGAVAVSTPFDDQIAALSRDLDATRLGYGTREDQLRHAEKSRATDKLTAAGSSEALARRGVYNATASGWKNAIGERDLIADLTSEQVALEEIPSANLPDAIRLLPEAERAPAIAELATKRVQLRTDITQLAAERQRYIDKTVAEKDKSGSFEQQIHETLSRQAAKVGLELEAETHY